MEVNIIWVIFENLILLSILTSLYLLIHRKNKLRQNELLESSSIDVNYNAIQNKNNEIIKLLEENEKLKETLEQISKKNELLKSELESKNTDLDRINNELKEVKDDYEKLNILIDTVSSLLNGKTTDKLKEIEKINKIEKFLLNEFIPKIDDMNIIENEYIEFSKLKEKFEQWKLTQIRGWDKGKINVALIGKFSSGKSSVVNSLIGTSLLPVNTNPTTAVPTFVSHGYDDKVYYEDKEGKIREIDIGTFNNISYVTLKDFPVSFFIKYFVVFTDLSSFREINILDTPGFSSDNAIDRDRAEESAKQSDAIFYIIDINDGTLTQEAIDILKKIENENLFIILNKSDTKSPCERETVKSHIMEVLKENQIKYNDIIIYSSKKNIDNCYEQLSKIIKDIKKKKIEEGNFFDKMIEMCQLCINHLKANYSLTLSDRETEQIESKIKTLKALIEKTKEFRRDII